MKDLLLSRGGRRKTGNGEAETKSVYGKMVKCFRARQGYRSCLVQRERGVCVDHSATRCFADHITVSLQTQQMSMVKQTKPFRKGGKIMKRELHGQKPHENHSQATVEYITLRVVCLVINRYKGKTAAQLQAFTLWPEIN